MFFPAKVRVAVAGLAVAGGAATAALLGPAGPAVGQSSPPIQAQIQVNSPATIVAKGAAVNVSVTAGCSAPGESGFVVVSLTETVQRKIAYGSAEDSIACTGTSQTLDLLVTAGSTGPSGFQQGASKAFAQGVAIANASIEACSGTGLCNSVQVQPIIKIGK